MTELSFRPIEDRDVATVIDLWHRCGLTQPHNDPHRDLSFARGKSDSDILVGEVGGQIRASVMVGHDGHRGTVYYVSVDPDSQGLGFGRQLMGAAHDWLKDRDIWKVNLLIREGNTAVQGFYESLGYESEPRTCMAYWLNPPDHVQ